MWVKSIEEELYHYGVPGMKWGVRRKSSIVSPNKRKDPNEIQLDNFKKRREKQKEKLANKTKVTKMSHRVTQKGKSIVDFLLKAGTKDESGAITKRQEIDKKARQKLANNPNVKSINTRVTKKGRTMLEVTNKDGTQERWKVY